jgi:WD40 repeat protein
VIKIRIQDCLTQIKFLDEDKVVVCTDVGTAPVYEIETKKNLFSLHHGASSVTGSVFIHCHCIVLKTVSIAISDDLIATCCWDGSIKLWDPRSGKCIQRIDVESEAFSVEYVIVKNGK